jgi:HK97 gp10 family phage protein
MPAQISIDVKGMKELQRKNEQMVRDLRGEPMLDAMRKCTLMVQRDAKINAPVKTGRLRASITPEVRVEGKADVIGVVGSNVEYAPIQEFGSGAFVELDPKVIAETPGSQYGRNVHGTHYLGHAYESNAERILEIIQTAVKGITDK